MNDTDFTPTTLIDFIQITDADTQEIILAQRGDVKSNCEEDND